MFSMAVGINTRYRRRYGRLEKTSFDDIIPECLVPVSRALLKPTQVLLELRHQRFFCTIIQAPFWRNLPLLTKARLYVELQSAYQFCSVTIALKYTLTTDRTKWCKIPSTVYYRPLTPHPCTTRLVTPRAKMNHTQH